MALTLLASPGASHAATPFDELLAELSTAIAGEVAEIEALSVTPANPGQDEYARALAAMLAKRGLRVGGIESPQLTVITCACTITVRERLCLAEVRRNDSTRLLSARRTHDVTDEVPLVAPMVLEVRPLISQRAPILDVAVGDARMLVLDSHGVTHYDRTGRGWQARQSQPISRARAWPRDMRGRIVSTATSFDAYLPGTLCRGTIEPFTISCVEQQFPWPVGFENQGLTPARNYFSLASGMYYGMASLDADAGAQWLAARNNGTLVLLDAARVPLSGPLANSHDVVRLETGCASGSHVLIVPDGGETSSDVVRLYRVADRRLEPATPPAALPGTLTALWPADPNTATAVSRNAITGGYEAFQVRVSCGR